MKQFIVMAAAIIMAIAANAQGFESSKVETPFEGVKVKVGGDFALQYQSITHEADSALIELGTGINLPTANLVIDGYLAKGVTVNLTTYLSSRHHVEAWVMGGYLQMDALPFIKSDVVDNIMELLTIKVGLMTVDFGDAHFRRSNNGNVINNPFVGNYIMDAFTTAPAVELLFRHNGIILMAGVNSGTLKPAISAYSSYSGYTAYDMHKELAFYYKAGYDKQITDNVRIRGTFSGYHNAENHFGSLYNGDRTGSRYYLVMKPQTGNATDVDPSSGHTTGRWGPGFTNKNTAFMVNLFVKVYGLEVFGTYETTSGTTAFGGAEYQFDQIAAEALYRFGAREQFFGGARFNTVSNDSDMSINRTQVVAGWDITDNIILKAEYVNQQYDGFVAYGDNAGFKGMMIETAISF